MRVMGKPVAVAFMLCSMAMAMLLAAHVGASRLTHSQARHSSSTAAAATQSMDEWFAELKQANEELTKLQFYIHQNSDGQTVYPVAEANVTPESPVNFGQVQIIDNLMTEGPEPDSQVLGRYQGLFCFTDRQIGGAILNFNIYFTEGQYKGSTVTILGREPLTGEVRIMHAVGGTGSFVFARGLFIVTRYSTNPAQNASSYLIDLYLLTPKMRMPPISSIFSG